MSADVHTHVNNLQGGTLSRDAFETATASKAGSLPVVTGGGPAPTFAIYTIVDVALDPDCFFPMIHISSTQARVVGHTTDGSDHDNPRLALTNIGFGSVTYDVDYRYMTA